MNGYEYIQVSFDWGDLDQINSLGSVGWRIIHVADGGSRSNMALLMREMDEAARAKAEAYYAGKRGETKGVQ